MSEVEVWLAGIGGLVVVFVVGLWFVRLDSRRARVLADFARNNGWSYAEETRFSASWRGYPFNVADDARGTSVVRGEFQGRRFHAMYVRWTTKLLVGEAPRRLTVVALELGQDLPWLVVVPQSSTERAIEAAGALLDHDVESEPFNRAYRVFTDDSKFASDVLHPRLVHDLVGGEPLSFGITDHLLAGWGRERLTPGRLVITLHRLDAIADSIPGYVWRDHEASA